VGRAAVSGPRSVSWRHHRRVIPVISGNRSTAGHVTIIGTLSSEVFTVVSISAIRLAVLPPRTLSVIVIAVSGCTISTVGARRAQRVIVLEVRVIDRQRTHVRSTRS